jgi:Ribbon-helix-helix protein, copG family
MLEIMTDSEVRVPLGGGAALMIVPVLRDSGRSAKANISLDAGTLEALDEAGREHGLSRSAFIASAAREKIERGT